MPGTRKLGRATDHRRAMLRAMVTFLLEKGRIETTVTRAKEVRSIAEKMITTAKQGDLHSKRQVFSFITKSFNYFKHILIIRFISILCKYRHRITTSEYQSIVFIFMTFQIGNYIICKDGNT